MYFKSRTDLDIVQRPSPTPVMGPAGSIITDPNFGNKIVRLTDEHSMFGGQNAYAGIGGSADVNTCNTDTTLVYIEDNGGGGAIISFDPFTLQPKRIFPGWRPNALVFSRLDPNVAFSFKGTQYLQFDLSDRALNVPPTPVVVCDFAHLLPANTTWKAIGGVEAADTMFAGAFSTTGAQGTGVYACAFSKGKGYRLYNTSTGQITGDYGPTGQASIPDTFTIHNVKTSKDGGWLVISRTTHMTGTNPSPYFWDIDTLNIVPNSHIAATGHWTAGYEEYLNNDSHSPDIPYWSHVHRSLLDMNHPIRIANPSPSGPLMVGLDDHLSFNGPKGGMVVSTSASVNKITAFMAPWWNEVLGFDLSGNGKVYRFCHTFESNISGNFYADNAIGVVDQLNKFAFWTSDWGGTLKNANGTKRIDVFGVEFR